MFTSKPVLYQVGLLAEIVIFQVPANQLVLVNDL